MKEDIKGIGREKSRLEEHVMLIQNNFNEREDQNADLATNEKILTDMINQLTIEKEVLQEKNDILQSQKDSEVKKVSRLISPSKPLSPRTPKTPLNLSLESSFQALPIEFRSVGTQATEFRNLIPQNEETLSKDKEIET